MLYSHYNYGVLQGINANATRVWRHCRAVLSLMHDRFVFHLQHGFVVMTGHMRPCSTVDLIAELHCQLCITMSPYHIAYVMPMFMQSVLNIFSTVVLPLSYYLTFKIVYKLLFFVLSKPT